MVLGTTIAGPLAPVRGDDSGAIAALSLGPYLVRLEPPQVSPLPSGVGYLPSLAQTVTIWRGNLKVAEEDYVQALGALTGTDITGDGYPDVIVECYSGGAHCCFQTVVYSLGEWVQMFRAGRESNCPGEFQDLDGDGVYEFLTCDDIFAYYYCAFSDSPLVKVILRFEPGVGYIAANQDFPALYAEDITAHTALAEEVLHGDRPVGFDGTPKCGVLPLVLDYLYSGQVDRGWEALYHYYQLPDVEAFRADIEQVIARSRYFTRPD
jgi:hypothetical protein